MRIPDVIASVRSDFEVSSSDFEGPERKESSWSTRWLRFTSVTCASSPGKNRRPPMCEQWMPMPRLWHAERMTPSLRRWTPHWVTARTHRSAPTQMQKGSSVHTNMIISHHWGMLPGRAIALRAANHSPNLGTSRASCSISGRSCSLKFSQKYNECSVENRWLQLEAGDDPMDMHFSAIATSSASIWPAAIACGSRA